ncbi:Ubiquitin Carboxyl-Terminal Hydrolase 24, partial [Manis pentadactyla]
LRPPLAHSSSQNAKICSKIWERLLDFLCNPWWVPCEVLQLGNCCGSSPFSTLCAEPHQ